MEGVDRVAQLQRQMLIHSYLYYSVMDPIWTDDEWQAKANELATLDMTGSPYEEEFKDWNGSTGYHLCAIVNSDDKLYTLADRLLRRYHELNRPNTV